MVAEEVVVSLAGGAPWGFRLQGGVEQQKPLQVAKVRRRSKACRAGLKEDDELVAIGDQMCTEFSHAEAMTLIDTQRGTLNLRVKRAPSGTPVRSASPRSSMNVLSHTMAPRCITSPPDSEAYYGETDSDADTQMHTHRRPRRTPPHARLPCRYGNQEEEETSEMSGYESAPDGGMSSQAQWEMPILGEPLPGVPRREVLYQPIQSEWSTPAHTPHTLTPRTLTPTPDQGLVEGEGEGDSGFQETGGCVMLACSPLVSPERAKEALMLSSSRQLVPMVGPQTPMSDDLSTTYKDKARQAKLQRGESVVEKQVKEARTKCRSIASLLTDAPNPNSKGVLMFKKRRQRAKKYTLTCFGKAEGDTGTETEGETGGETEEEGGSSFQSGSEVDEEGFSASFDPTWDSGYLDVLDRRSSACPSTTPTTPTTPTAANHNQWQDASPYQSPGIVSSAYQSPGVVSSAYQSPGVVSSAYQSPGFVSSAYQSPGLECSTYQSPGLESSAYQPFSLDSAPKPALMSPPAVSLTNGGSVGVSRASVVLSPPSHPALPAQPEQHPGLNFNRMINSEPNLNTDPNPANSLNRTARPFTPGPTSSRPSVAPVTFRPPQPKPTTITTVTKPVAAVSMVTIPTPRQPPGPEARRAVSSTSLYIPPRSNNSSAPSVLSPPPVHSPPSVLSPPSHLASAPFSHPPANPPPFSPQSSVPHAPFSSPSTPLSPSSAQVPPLYPSPAQPLSPPVMHTQPFPPPQPPSYYTGPPLPSQPPAQAQVYTQAPPPPPTYAQPPPPLSFNPYIKMTNPVTSETPAAMATSAPPQAPASDSLESREHRVSVPATRTGILQNARQRANKKPMFCAVQNRKDVSPNPALLSMLQNMQDGPGTGSAVPHTGGVAGGEAGHESGPEEDWLRLGAEACNFMQAQRGTRPPPVAPKPQAPQVPQLGGKGGQLFARRQSRMDRYVVDRSPSVAATPYSPAQNREPSPTPSLPATWKYSSSIRAGPPISYNPLLSPSCPLKAQKPQKVELARSGPAGGSKAGKKGGLKPLDIMTHQPYQLNSSLFTYGGGTPQMPSAYQQQQGVTGGSQGPTKTARVYEVRRFSTPPPMATGPSLKVIVPRSATTLGERLWHSPSPPPAPYQHYQPPPEWASPPLAPAPPPAPTTPLPQLPTFSSSAAAAPYSVPLPMPTFSHIQFPPNAAQANRGFKSAPDLSPLGPGRGSQPVFSSSSHLPARVPKPRFSTSNLGLQPSVWRPGSTLH